MRMHRLTLPFFTVTVVSHPPYSPDLALCDFYLFPRLKMKLKDRRFDTVEVNGAKSQAMLNFLTEHDFRMHLKMAEALGPVYTCGRGLRRE
jgi:hypothetical protein